MKLFSKAKSLFDGGRNKDPLSQNAMEDLIDHVRNGDVDYIKTVDPNVLWNARGKDGSTVLMMATNKANLNLCKEILKKCPSLLYHQNNYNRTVLHQAIDSFISCESFLFIDIFVSVGVDDLEKNIGDIYMEFKRWMKVQDLKGDTALVIAARYGYLHVVKRLVEIDRQYYLGLSEVIGDKGKTALDCAVEKEDHEIVKLLTDDKGDPYSDFVPYSTAMNLFQHVRNGDLDYIKTVELNVLLNSRDQDRMSALYIAAVFDQLDCCKAILKRCPFLLYHPNKYRWSVLHHAAYEKKNRLIDFFVSAGLEAAKRGGGWDNMIRFKKWINLQNRDDRDTALILAVINGSHDIVKRFVEVDHQYKLGLSKIINSHKKTALQCAIHREDHEMIKMLTGSGDPNLDYGANTDDGNFPISMAMQQTQKSLQTGNSSGTGGKNAATDKCSGGRNEDSLSRNATEVLIDHVWCGNVDYIKTIAQNALLKTRDEDESTVLMMATNMGNLNLCKEILKKCPPLLYHQNNYNETVLHQATADSFILCENFWFIDFFVGVGVDELEPSNYEGDIFMKFERWMKVQDLEGDTALVIAARCGYLHVVKKFVEVDRRYNLGLSKVVGNKAMTALDWAVEKEDHEMVKLLTDEEGDPYSNFVPYSTAMDLFQHVRNGDLDYVKTVELNVLINSRDQHRMSVLSIATKCDQLDCCKAILQRCPSLLYHHNNDRWSVLHYAAYQKYYRLIDFFVSVGLEVAKSQGGTDNMIRFKKWINLQNRGDRDTALILAVIKGSHDIVTRFVEVDHQYKLGLSKIIGSNRKTALQWVIYHGNHEMIKMLTGSGDNLEYGAMQQTQESLQTGNSSGTGTGVVSKSNIFTFTDASEPNNLKDCWPLINDKVHDVTKFSGDHPGCDKVLLKARGKDATTDFKKVQCHGGNAVTVMDKFHGGVCDSITSSLIKLASDKPQPYSRMQLKEFTEDFSRLLGSGGFGDVYKGQFPNGVSIAVKVLKSTGSMEEVMEKQFVAEVDTIGRAYHRNLIKLHGYCYEPNTKFKALVFDYMEKGSFDTYLFKKKLEISWAELHNIAKQIAQGISYLHESCSPQIIHQDIKPSNVLLDANLCPKVTDFGLAKVVNVGEDDFEQTKIKGSRNYMAPEVTQLDKVKLSCKVDVYSFSMMLFDILGSKRNHVDNKGWFPGQVWKKYDTNHFDEFIIECGIKEKDKENAKRLATIAFLCVEHNPRARPMLSNVVTMLEGKIELGEPVAPFYPNYSSNESSSMSDSRDYSSNESRRGDKVSRSFQYELLVLVGCCRQVLVRCCIFMMLMLVLYYVYVLE